MAVFRQVQCEFWTDPKILEEMTPEDRYFYLYLLTNSHTTQIGIYPISRKVMGFELGYSMESVNSLLDRFRDHHKLIKYNEETRELAIINWGKYNLARGGKPMEDCVKKELKAVKDLSLIPVVGEHVANEKLKELFLTFNREDDTSTVREKEFEDEIIETEEDECEITKKKDDIKQSELVKSKTSINTHSNDTSTIRIRDGGNKNKKKKNNKNKNNNNKEEDEEEKLNTKDLKAVVVVLENKINIQEAKTILKAANGDIDLIKAKYEIAKVSRYKGLVGFMVRAIENNYQMPKKQDKQLENKNKVKTKFHNFKQRTDDYTPDELKQMFSNKGTSKEQSVPYIPKFVKI